MTSLEASSQRYWIIVPAAGIGARMGADCPKQYLSLLNKTILEHTLERLLAFPLLAGLLVAINPNDKLWAQLPFSQDARITRIDGGSERSHSVLNALHSLADRAAESDWVLVHDAARPCIRLSSIQHLCTHLTHDPVGGILAVPVSDTIKLVDPANTIIKTLDRRQLWQAQTPQMFRYGLLRDALANALEKGFQITDEASAMELNGHTHRVVNGRADNIKITRPEDLVLATAILQQQEKSI